MPPAFFELVLGPHLKYSGAFWPPGVTRLEDAERAMLDLTIERADLADGQRILELGCGWGSLSLAMARRFPHARILSVSNSHRQREFIMGRAKAEGLDLVRRIHGWLEPDGALLVHVFAHAHFAYPYETAGDDDWMARSDRSRAT